MKPGQLSYFFLLFHFVLFLCIYHSFSWGCAAIWYWMGLWNRWAVLQARTPTFPAQGDLPGVYHCNPSLEWHYWRHSRHLRLVTWESRFRALIHYLQWNKNNISGEHTGINGQYNTCILHRYYAQYVLYVYLLRKYITYSMNIHAQYEFLYQLRVLVFSRKHIVVSSGGLEDRMPLVESVLVKRKIERGEQIAKQKRKSKTRQILTGGQTDYQRQRQSREKR